MEMIDLEDNEKTEMDVKKINKAGEDRGGRDRGGKRN